MFTEGRRVVGMHYIHSLPLTDAKKQLVHTWPTLPLLLAVKLEAYALLHRERTAEQKEDLTGVRYANKFVECHIEVVYEIHLRLVIVAFV